MSAKNFPQVFKILTNWTIYNTFLQPWKTSFRFKLSILKLYVSRLQIWKVENWDITSLPCCRHTVSLIYCVDEPFKLTGFLLGKPFWNKKCLLFHNEVQVQQLKFHLCFYDYTTEFYNSWNRNTAVLLYNLLSGHGERKWLAHMIIPYYNSLWCYF